MMPLTCGWTSAFLVPSDRSAYPYIDYFTMSRLIVSDPKHRGLGYFQNADYLRDYIRLCFTFSPISPPCLFLLTHWNLLKPPFFFFLILYSYFSFDLCSFLLFHFVFLHHFFTYFFSFFIPAFFFSVYIFLSFFSLIPTRLTYSYCYSFSFPLSELLSFNFHSLFRPISIIFHSLFFFLSSFLNLCLFVIPLFFLLSSFLVIL